MIIKWFQFHCAECTHIFKTRDPHNVCPNCHSGRTVEMANWEELEEGGGMSNVAVVDFKKELNLRDQELQKILDRIQHLNNIGELEEVFVTFKNKSSDNFHSETSAAVSTYRAIGMLEELKSMLITSQ